MSKKSAVHPVDKSDNLLRRSIVSLFHLAESWDRFWFSPRDSRDITWIRIAIGLTSAVYALTWLTNLGLWISDDGLLSRSQTEFLIGRGVEGTGSEGRVSLLYTGIPSGFAWAYVLITSLTCLTVVSGFLGRLAVFAAWALLLGLVHRIPMLQGPGDFLITGLFGYLLIYPGEVITKRRSSELTASMNSSWLCNLAVRLIQCHVFVWFMASLASHLGEPMWWNGTAPWWLSFSGDQSWISLRFWLDFPYLMNLASLSILGVQFWILISFLAPSWKKSGVVALILFALFNLVIANDWVYALAILACIPVLRVSSSCVLASN